MNQPANQQTPTPTANTVIIPSNPADRKRIKQLLQEISNCYSRMEHERGTVKDTVATIHEEFGIPKKMVTKMARTFHKHNFQEVRMEQEDFETLYELIEKS